MNTHQQLRETIEAGLGRWGSLIARRPWPTLGVSSLLMLGLIAQVPHITVDTSDQSFLRDDAPSRMTNDLFSRQFGRNGQVLIAVKPSSIFEIGFLETLRKMHEELESIAQVQDVSSLINARNTFGRDDELVVEDLLEDWPANESDLRTLRTRVLANPLYRNHLISADGRVTTISVKLDTYSSTSLDSEAAESEIDFAESAGPESLVFLTPVEERAAVSRVREVLARYEGPGFHVFLTGAAAFDEAFITIMRKDIKVYIGLSGGLIALMLLLLFRRVAAVLLPMTIVSLALLCDVGTMAALGVPITLPMQILPSFLLAVGTCASVHILVVFYRDWEGGSSREDAIASALEHSGLPVVMAGLTTAGGLLSFVTSDLAPIADFGFFGPIGVIYVLLVTLVLLPALLAVVPMRPSAPNENSDRLSIIDRILISFGFAATRYPRSILMGTFVLLVVAVSGTTRLSYSHDPISWLPKDNVFRSDTEFIDRALGGSISLDVLIESGEENGLYDPALLQSIDQLAEDAHALEGAPLEVGKIISVADIVKETHQALSDNRPKFFRVPDERRLIAQELLLFENSGSDDLEELVDSTFSMAAVTLKLPWADGITLAQFVELAEAQFKETIGDRARVTLTGGTVIFARTFTAVIQSMAESYALALFIITPLMILLIGNVRRGLLSMVPNLVPIVMTLGLMGWMGASLDFSSMLLGAIVLGVAVDDTIHFLHVFERNFQQNENVRSSVRMTLRTTGRAITVTSIVLGFGFGAFMLSGMGNMVGLGFYTCFAIFVALLADILIAPALLMLTRGGEPLIPARASARGGSADRIPGDIAIAAK
ncbi:MAG: MMPL family transporter [Deltaproteobacteria bacterium]|nr:MMPL family transporter [Deltaproteobacteria bacterium]